MKTLLTAVSALAFLSVPALADSIHVKDLGVPECVMPNPTPFFTDGSGHYINVPMGTQSKPNGAVIAKDVYASWPELAGHSPYSALVGDIQATFAFSEPQASISFAWGTVGNTDEVRFFQNHGLGTARTLVGRMSGAKLLQNLHMAGTPNVYVRLTLDNATFNRVEFSSTGYSFEFGNINAMCGK